jgi:hypothetical protein
MPIAKGSFVAVVTKKNGTINAIVDKVFPDPNNPKQVYVKFTSIGIISDAQGDYKIKGTAHISSCTAIADPSAPTDPIMAKWSLGKEKKGPEMMEGYYFASPILLHGKKVGEAVDEGNGGDMYVRCSSSELARMFEKDCAEWLKKNCPGSRYADGVSDFYLWWHDARPIGKDAATYLREEKEKIDAMCDRHDKATKTQTPVGNTDEFVKAVASTPK